MFCLPKTAWPPDFSNVCTEMTAPPHSLGWESPRGFLGVLRGGAFMFSGWGHTNELSVVLDLEA